jgi:type III secretion protein S
MDQAVALAKFNESLLTILMVSGPVLIAALLIGVLVGLLQALTQIQDQTLPQAVKIIVVLVIIIIFGPVLAQQVGNEALMALDEFPALTR